MSKTLLVDGDIVAYKAATIAETPIDWGDGLWTLHAHEKDVVGSIEEFMSKIIEESKCEKVITCLTGTSLYRKDIAPYYKENRKTVRKPMLLNFAKKYLADVYNGKIENKLEADDLLGILGSSSDDYIIWSEDKDLLTVPANHLVHGQVVQIDNEQADYNFFYQTLVGDSTDNYKGCPTIGDKKANKILQEKGATWETVVDTYAKQNLSEEVAIENARLARILRVGEYDFETKEVSLWAA
ncbi:MAG: putative ribonuclease H [Prokaryotic dsDNA virus sp.]|jgi:DNA polymerase-1|nr:MAG: putative ribonuclease H [Prokaryotic dsDNA virus sp.]|tara:strand:- start:1245 stop:1964 length:720 start_codon:yes stop_codon:yes gene_type:complete